jgi:hypothetical protein
MSNFGTIMSFQIEIMNKLIVSSVKLVIRENP